MQPGNWISGLNSWGSDFFSNNLLNHQKLSVVTAVANHIKFKRKNINWPILFCVAKVQGQADVYVCSHGN